MLRGDIELVRQGRVKRGSANEMIPSYSMCVVYMIAIRCLDSKPPRSLIWPHQDLSAWSLRNLPRKYILKAGLYLSLLKNNIKQDDIIGLRELGKNPIFHF